MQLTKKEVVELIATISANSYRAVEDRIECITELSEWKQEEHLGLAKDIIQALEDNRILCLVEGEAKEGDLVYDENAMPYEPDYYKLYDNYAGDKYFVIQRNSIPAYHCKQETQGAE